MRTEEDFITPLMDESVDLDFSRILVYADWLEENNRPEASGFRALALHQLCPWVYDYYHGGGRKWVWWGTVKAWWAKSERPGSSTLVKAWHQQLFFEAPGQWKVDWDSPPYDTRWEAVTAAVRAFGRLTEKLKVKLLEGKE